MKLCLRRDACAPQTDKVVSNIPTSLEGVAVLGLSQVSVPPGASLVATGIGAYLFFIVLVRRIAPRRLASAPLFDFGCVVACGAVVGATALASQSSLTSWTLTLATLAGMHQLLGLLSQNRTINALANRTPLLLVQDGVLLRDNLRKASLGEEDVRLAIRGSGIHLVSDVRYVVLERDGGLSVIGGQGTIDPWLLVDLAGQDSERRAGTVGPAAIAAHAPEDRGMRGRASRSEWLEVSPHRGSGFLR